MLGDELVENLVTWVYEEGSYVPVAKIQNGERYTIISDYMGRPVEAYNSYGNVVWQADYDIYDDLRNIKGIRDFIPFHQLGQYDSTKQVYREWLKEKTGKPVGGKVAWEEISPHEIFKLSEDMFDAAGVPQYARDEYYKEFNKYIYTMCK